MSKFENLQSAMLAVAMAASAFVTAVQAAPGDRHLVDGDVVNLRSGPSTQNAISFKLQRGAPLKEVSRKPDWIQVDTAGGRAWIYAKLTKPAPEKKSKIPPRSSKPVAETAEFREFKTNFDELNQRIKGSTDYTLFSDATYRGNGVVQVTATEKWLSQDAKARNAKLDSIYYMWLAAQDGPSDIGVVVVDENGNQRMEKTQ